MINNIILSPHYDDAVFSCFSLLNKNALVLNIFTKKPDNKKIALWDFLCGEPRSNLMMEKRTKENSQIFEELGVKYIDLDFFENQYSKNTNTDNITSSILKYVKPGDIIYAPACKSRVYIHPDHKIINTVANKLHASHNIKVKYYYDIPYMSISKNSIANHKNEVVTINDDLIRAKIKFSKAYKTQYLPTNLVSFMGLSRSIKRGKEIFINEL